MLARVQITLQVKPDVLIVPNGAVRTVGKRRFVEYLDGEIKRSRNVELGIVTDQETEITSGLQEGWRSSPGSLELSSPWPLPSPSRPGEGYFFASARQRWLHPPSHS